LDVLHGLQPEAWQRGNLDAELDRAIGAIEDAEGEYGKVTRRLASVLPEGSGTPERSSTIGGGAMPQNFVAWMRCGLAFTLPLIAALILFSIVSHFFTR